MGKKLTLIVEDCKTQAEEIKHLLKTNGYEVIHALNTEEALNLLNQSTPNVIISDIVMPEMDGFAFCSKIKKDKRLNKIPVILLTPLSDPSDIIKGLNSGADSFVIKPYNEEDLLLKIQHLLLNFETRQEDYSETGLEIKFLGKNHYITSSRAQIIELLISTFETVVKKNKELILSNNELKITQEKLNNLNETLERKVEERTQRIDHINCVLKAIRSVNQLIIRETDRSSLIRNVVREITEALNLSSIFIALSDSNEKIIDYAEDGLMADTHDFKESLLKGYLPYCFRKTAESDDIVLINDMVTNYGDCPRVNYLNHHDTGIFSKRLKTKNYSYGIINFAIPKKHLADEQELSLFKEIADDIAYGLHHMELGKNREKSINALRESENKLAEQNKEYQKLNKEYLIVNQELIESLDRIRKINTELIGAKEKSEESDKLKSAFLSNMSHEIRTPLNTIIGFAALLARKDLTKEDIDSFNQIINSSSQQLLSIINDILEISKIEAGLLKFNKNEINLNNLLNSLFKQFNPKTAEKGIEFRYETALSDNNANIQTDNTKLVQVLSNLLSNAIKFTDQGRIDFGYSLRDKYLQFYVSDTGIGIPDDQHVKIFNRFYQVEYSMTRQYEGNGLGLSISKAYVEFLNGKIWLASQPGKGTVFYFTIPYIIAGKPARPKRKSTENEKVLFKEKKTVLIAEDEENNFQLMVELLSKLNLNFLHVRNGKEAVDICKSGQNVDLVLMDIKMPVMDGYEATRLIKKLNPGLPVIAQTAYAFDTDRKNALNAGCDDYISKPVRKDFLISLVEKYI